ncbi:MAG: FAD-binding domain-containing protein [Pseudomonadota bacterium]
MFDRPATRLEADHIADAFQPRMGRRYANGRNTDRGAGAHRDVSTLSPYLRRRLITEPAVIARALAAHGPDRAEKFIQEVVWRSYFKGWLERRPETWLAYRTGLQADLEALDRDRGLRRAVSAAEDGQTRLDCMDAWAQELVATGYLHNHARMWFASIWIFTLELPWRLGADFFLRHLLDGDPASNTLGWRWVAGLHTRGRPYEASARNIAQYTDGRFQPRPADIAAGVRALSDFEEPGGLPELRAVRTPAPPLPDVPTALLITEDDCRPDDFDLAALDIRGVATLAGSHLRSPRAVADGVAEFEARALADAAAHVPGDVPVQHLKAGVPGDLARWAASLGARQIATPFVPVGPLRDWLDEAMPALEAGGIALVEWQRGWDRQLWPLATAGFFKVKKQIPRLLQVAGLGADAVEPI